MHNASFARFVSIIQPSSAFMLMCLSARLFHCARCLTQTMICRHCDRGHQYCSPLCAFQAKCESRQRANQKYAKSRRGKHNNAERQRRFRERQSEKVTDQGSQARPALVSSPKWTKSPNWKEVLAMMSQHCHWICHFCFNRISLYLRNDYLLR